MTTASLPAQLPTAAEQTHLRVRPHGTPGFVLLLLTAGIWLAAWATWHSLWQQPPAVALAPQVSPTFSQTAPEVVLVLLETPSSRPSSAPTRRTMQHVRNDLTTLFGHVAQELLKDEFESIILKVSLGEQVAVHLRDSLR